MSVIIQTEDFDPGDEIAHLGEGDVSVGAVASFVGLVRGDDDLSQMTLEHYAGFAEAEIAKHVAEAERRWPLSAVRVIHRTGPLKPGDRIVFVGVASAHRQAAFEACQFLMDYLKTKAPFWKEEERSGASSWVEAKSEDDAAAKKW
jgi:molybdopterin synthase catalytic subunit